MSKSLYFVLESAIIWCFAAALQKEMMNYAQQLAGKALELKATPQGNLWAARLSDGTTVNVRDFSNCRIPDDRKEF